MEYLKTHVRDFPQLRLALAQLAVAMQIDCFDAMADACAIELYKHVLQCSQQRDAGVPTGEELAG
eukprot:COSAG01_NODE_26198_length_721_cov_0.964630_1_plen_65_part_00